MIIGIAPDFNHDWIFSMSQASRGEAWVTTTSTRDSPIQVSQNKGTGQSKPSQAKQCHHCLYGFVVMTKPSLV
jgi:hypothetical protein